MAFKLLPLIMAALALSSCSGGTEAFCKATNPIFLQGDDVLTEGTLRDVIANEEARQELCGRFNGHELFDLGVGKKAS